MVENLSSSVLFKDTRIYFLNKYNLSNLIEKKDFSNTIKEKSKKLCLLWAVHFLLQKRTLLRFLSSFLSLNFIECLFCGGGWTIE